MSGKFHVMSYGWENTKYIHATQLIFQSNLGLILSWSNQDKEKLKLQEWNIQCFVIISNVWHLTKIVQDQLLSIFIIIFYEQQQFRSYNFVLKVIHCSLNFAKHKHLHSMTDVKMWAFKLICYLFFKVE